MDDDSSRLKSRAYQLEMFYESLKRNVIVVMATGSGKTHIACLRIEAELERSPGKRVWFTAPNSVLADQQEYFLTTQLRRYRMRTLLGRDDVDLWRSQHVWDAALMNIDVVVSTPQVLLDALRNAFVHLEDISLLVVDEAHHCQAGSAQAKTMSDYYHPLKQSFPSSPPAVLGLTASIRISEKTAPVQELERNLDAVCRSPVQSFDEYALFVHMPQFVELGYNPSVQASSILFQTLCTCVMGTRVEDDPYYQKLQLDDDPKHSQKLRQINLKQTTPAMRELNALKNHAHDLHQNLGSWASDTFISASVQNWHDHYGESIDIAENLTPIFIEQRLAAVRKQCEFPSSSRAIDLSEKARTLINFLEHEYHKGISVIIFVERRSSAFALTQLLQASPSMRNYRVFSFVGLACSGPKMLVEVADQKLQKRAFADFRSGSQDICVATSVAEEGIDVQAVNLVIRYDDPKHVAAYLQSRGRARKRLSKFVYLRNKQKNADTYAKFAAMEKQMMQECQEAQRGLHILEQANARDRTEKDEYIVPGTGAKLVYQNAKAHLQHFCGVVGRGAEPIYILDGDIGVKVVARVLLPSSVPVELQEIWAAATWLGDKAATQDAAFQAVKALHQAGLISDNLVPFRAERIRQAEEAHGTRLYTIPGEISVWTQAMNRASFFEYSLEVCHETSHYPVLRFAVPFQFNEAFIFEVCDTTARRLSLTVKPETERMLHDERKAKHITEKLFREVFGAGSAWESLQEPGRLPFLMVVDNEDFGVVPLPDFIAKHHIVLDHQPIFVWKSTFSNRRPYLWYPTAKDDLKAFSSSDNILVTKVRKLRLFTTSLGNVDDTATDVVGSKALLDTRECITRKTASIYGPLVALLPTVLHMMTAALRAQAALSCLMPRTGLDSVKHIFSALIAKSASGLTNYERLEFLGDATLKFRASLQMFANTPSATEDLLTFKTHELISNLRLEKSIKDIGLETYITTEVPPSKHWKLPEIVSTDESTKGRKINSKTLADVAESLLGAAVMDDIENDQIEVRSTLTLQFILPEVEWSTSKDIVQNLLHMVDEEIRSDSLSSFVQQMLGYRFQRHSLLLEALTHSTHQLGRRSYDRLEFLGDAILDQILKTKLFSYAKLQPGRMTHCRHAVASHVLLAYCVLQMHYSQPVNRIQMEDKVPMIQKSESEFKHLTDLIQTGDAELRKDILEARIRFEACSSEIEYDLTHKEFPWAVLQGIDAPKPCSDILESLLAAIFLDTGGSLEACEAVLVQLGIMNLLNRMASINDFEVRNPIERLRRVCDQRKFKVELTTTAAGDNNGYCSHAVIKDNKDCVVFEDASSECQSKEQSVSVVADRTLRLLSNGHEKQVMDIQNKLTPMEIESTSNAIDDQEGTSD